MSKIDIGIPIDIEILMETRLMVESDSGSGKSRALRKMAEECSGKVQQIIIDPEGEFVTLREKYPFALVCKVGGDIPLNMRYAEALAHKILETGISVIIDLYDLKQPDREQFIKLFCEALMDAPKNLRHSILLYIDECQLYCPEDKRAISTHAIIDVATRGRKRGICLVVATLRISILNKSLAAQCKNKLMGSTSLPLDQKRVGEELGLTTKEDIRNLRNLEKGEFYAFGPAISKEIVKFRTGPIKTTHISSGAKLTSPPPTPAAIKKILSKLEAIPDEAEKELKSKKEFQDEIKRLNVELKKKPAPAVAPQDGNLKTENAFLKSQLQAETNAYAALVKIVKNKNAEWVKALKVIDGLTGIEIPEKVVMAQPLLPKDYVKVDRVVVVQRTQHPKSHSKIDTDQKPLPIGEKAVLTACAQFGHTMERNQLTVLTGYKRSSRDAYIARLKEKGYLESDGGGVVATEAGMAMLGDDFEPLPTGEELQKYWLNRLPAGERSILDMLITAYPNPVDRESISNRTGYMRSSRDAYLARMASKELVVMAGRGEVKASDNLFN